MKTPCYCCDERHVHYDNDGRAHTCHETCERYAECVQKNERKRARRAEYMNNPSANAIIARLKKTKWKKNKSHRTWNGEN